MKILNFGSCNIDYVYSLEHIVRPGETERTASMEIFPGGKGLNQSVAAARAGGAVFHAGLIGCDGGFLRQFLSDSGVDISFMEMINSKNGHAVIQVAGTGENAIFLHPGTNEMLTEGYIDSVLENFASGDIVILQNEVNAVDYIVEKAFEKGLQIALNPSPSNERIKAIDLNKITYLILNKVEAADITGCEVPADCLSYFRTNYPELTVVLTLGNQGSILQNKDGQVFQSAYPVTAVDTTAAGDTFMGYFAAGIAGGDTYANILKTASAAAAIAVTQKGAAPSIPVKKQVLAFLNKVQE